MENQAENSGRDFNSYVVLKARGVLMNVYDKLSSLNLSPQQSDLGYTRECKQRINWSDDKLWDVPAPSSKPKFLMKGDCLNLVCDLPDFAEPSSKSTLKKYFTRWKNHVKYVKEKRMVEQKRLQETNKLDQLIETIKKTSSAPAVSKPPKKEHLLKDESVVFKNRFKAQKNIIERQKQQIEEQNKLIQELKLGIIREDLYKSIDSTKVDIQEIFKNCTGKLKASHPHLQSTNDRDQIMINSQKAPKIVMAMERRAKEREIKREIILERKRLLDLQKQKILEELVERKKQAEEEERRKNLEMVEEKRRRDMELYLRRKLNREIYSEKMDRAVRFFHKKLMKNSLGKLRKIYKDSQRNFEMAECYFEEKTKRKVFDQWNSFIEEKYRFKYELADSVYEFTLLKRVVKNWHNLCVEIRLNMQTASDYYDYKLSVKILKNWKTYTYHQSYLMEKKLNLADEHYKRKILFQYYFQWKSLPAVIQLEKAKEMKKLKWRTKVLEILPDYRPPES